MTRDELRIQIFDDILGFVAENYIPRMLLEGLKLNDNNPDRTIQWFIDHEYDPPVMGGHVGDIQWDFMVGWRGVGEGYLPGHNSWNSPPDITFTYKDLLIYLAAGRPKNVQLEMF